MEKKQKSLLDLIKHILIAVVATIVLVYGFFNIYLPLKTNHGETITVPNLEGMEIEELDEFLNKRSLRYEIEPDSGYSAKYPAFAVIKQFPLPNSKVKENRKIYVNLNASNPPKVKLPNVITRSIKNAQLEFRSLGLAIGEITYKPDFALNAILELSYNGRTIKAGDLIPRGAIIDIVAGDGLGNQSFDMPDLIGIDLDEAQFIVKGTGLKLGNISYAKEGKTTIEEEDENGNIVLNEVSIDPGFVFKQKPTPGRRTKIGAVVDLWIVEIDSASLNSQPNLDVIED